MKPRLPARQARAANTPGPDLASSCTRGALLERPVTCEQGVSNRTTLQNRPPRCSRPLRAGQTHQNVWFHGLKIQIPNKLSIPNSHGSVNAWFWNLGRWNLFGIWDFVRNTPELDASALHLRGSNIDGHPPPSGGCASSKTFGAVWDGTTHDEWKGELEN